MTSDDAERYEIGKKDIREEMLPVHSPIWEVIETSTEWV